MKKKKKIIVLLVVNIENLKTLKYHIFSRKKMFLFIICDKCGSENEKIFKEKESVEILKILCLIKNI